MAVRPRVGVEWEVGDFSHGHPPQLNSVGWGWGMGDFSRGHPPQLNSVGSGVDLTPPCVAESVQRHAQHPLKMLGIDFSCGLYQTNSERIMFLNSLYQTDMSLYSNRYLFVRSKIGGQK